MANNEIKVTIKADNKPFLEALKECTSEMKKFAQSASSMQIDTGKIKQAEQALEKLSDALKAVKGGQTVTVGADVSQALAALREIETAAKSQDTKIAVGVDKAQAIADIDGIQQALTKLSSTLSSISVDNSQAVKAAEETREALSKIPDEKVKLNIESEEALAAVKKLVDALKSIKGTKIDLKAGGNAQEDLAKLEENMRKVRSSLKSITVKVNTRTALKNIERLIHAARQLRNDLKGVKLPAENSAMASSLARVAALNRQILKTMKDINAEAKKMSTNMGGTSKAAESTLSKLGNLSLVAQGAAQIFETIKDMASTIVMPGFNFSKEMEMNQLGIAGILQSMTLLNGQAVEFSEAMGISADMMQKLQKDAIKTSATTGELVETFRAVLAPGIGAGMSLDEIQEFTTVGVNAVKAMGLQSNQFVQELRDLVQGGIAPASSTLATALGLTDADIKAAKASSEGLFKFLMERMKGFQPMAEKFPDTLQGKMSQLEEMSTLASAEITKAFESDFKEIVGYMTSLLGELNTKTGEFEVNPALLDVIDELKDGLQTLKDYIADLDDSGAFDWVDEAIPTLKSLYNILKDIGGTLMDLMRIMEAAAAPINEFIWGGIRLIANEVEWLTGKIRALIDTLSVKIGAKKERIAPRQIQDVADESRELYKNPYVNTKQITSKFPSKAQEEAAKKAEKERLKLAKSALKEMVGFWRTELDKVTRALETRRQENKARFEQGYIGADQYYLTDLQLKLQQQQAKINELEQEIQGENNLPVAEKDEADKRRRINELENKLEREREEYAKKEAEFDRIAKGAEKLNLRANVPGLAVESGKQITAEELGKIPVAVARQLIAEKDENGNPLHMYGPTQNNPNNFVCTQFVVKSWDGLGLEDALKAAGVETADSENRDMRDYVPTLMDVAKKLGAWADANSGYIPKAGDAIVTNGDNHVVMATGEGNGYVASASTGRPIAEYGDYKAAFEDKITGFISLQKLAEAAQLVAVDRLQTLFDDPGMMLGEDDLAWKQKREEISRTALEVMQKYFEGIGNVTKTQLAQMEADTKKTIMLLEQNGMPEVAEMARQNLANDKLRVRFSQLQMDLQYADDDLMDAQDELLYAMTAGTKDSTEAAEEYTAKAQELYSEKIQELRAQLAEALKRDQKDLAREIKQKLREVISTISEGIKAILNKIDAEANEEIEKITQNKSMTRLQKDDAIDAVKRRAAEDKVEVLEKNITNWESIRPAINQSEEKQKKFQKDHDGLTIDQAILEAQKEVARLNYDLEQIPTLLDKVQMAGKQAFEDGLVDFLTEGILQCENLGEAFRNLAVTVLQAIQRMYAEAVAKSIMGALFPVAGGMGAGSGSSSLFGTDYSGNDWLTPYLHLAEGGPVFGPGTGTSDSVLAALSNGEFVINAAAVRQIGLDTLNRINSGEAFKMRLPRFAEGGLIENEDGAAKGIADFANAALNNGMGRLSANIGTSFSPELHNNVQVKIDGDGVIKSLSKSIEVTVDKRMWDKAKEYSMISGLFQKR